MKKFLIAVALLTGCLTAPDAPDSTTTSDDPAAQAESENSSSQDLSVPENFDMQAWLQTINPKTCSAPPSCNLLSPARQCEVTIPTSCGKDCVRVPGTMFQGVCGTKPR